MFSIVLAFPSESATLCAPFESEFRRWCGRDLPLLRNHLHLERVSDDALLALFSATTAGCDDHHDADCGGDEDQPHRCVGGAEVHVKGNGQ